MASDWSTPFVVFQRPVPLSTFPVRLPPRWEEDGSPWAGAQLEQPKKWISKWNKFYKERPEEAKAFWEEFARDIQTRTIPNWILPTTSNEDTPTGPESGKRTGPHPAGPLRPQLQRLIEFMRPDDDDLPLLQRRATSASAQAGSTSTGSLSLQIDSDEDPYTAPHSGPKPRQPRSSHKRTIEEVDTSFVPYTDHMVTKGDYVLVDVDEPEEDYASYNPHKLPEPALVLEKIGSEEISVRLLS